MKIPKNEWTKQSDTEISVRNITFCYILTQASLFFPFPNVYMCSSKLPFHVVIKIKLNQSALRLHGIGKHFCNENLNLFFSNYNT